MKEISKLNSMRNKLKLSEDMMSLSDSNNIPYFSNDWVMRNILGYGIPSERKDIRKEKIKRLLNNE
jgi:hypothetical protein